MWWWIRAALTDDLWQRVAVAGGTEWGLAPLPPLTPFNCDTETNTHGLWTHLHSDSLCFSPSTASFFFDSYWESTCEGGTELVWDARSFFVSVLFLFSCVFLFCTFSFFFFAAPAVTTPWRVGRLWTLCQEMMSWPASPLTLVCVWHSSTIEVWLCCPGCYCACVHVCGQEDCSLCVCVHEEIVPQQL